MDVIVKVRDPEENLEEKIKAYKVKKRIKTAVTILAFVFALISSYLLVKLQTYTSLRTLQSYKNKETESSDLKYLQYADGMLKYGRDGIAYINKKGVEQWNQSYQIKDPVINVSGKAMAVAERGGNVLVEHRASLTGTGYPIGIALSPNGTRLQISYLCVADGVEATRVGYLNFDNTEEANKEYQVADDVYKNTIVPTSFFIDEKKSVLVGDQSFMIYKETDKPKLSKTVKLDKQIKSFFHDDEYLGFILKEESGEYELRLYDMEGNQKLSKTFTGEYGNVKIADGNVIMYDGTSCLIYSKLGVKQFEGTTEYEIKEVIPIFGINKYLVMNADGLAEVRLVK